MDVLPFGALPVGGCFLVATTLASDAIGAHLLRKVDRLHAD